MLTQLLEQLNPDLAAHVIDASERGPALVLRLKEALESGRMVGVMADRALAVERTIEVNFLGGTVHLPAGPWMLAHALQAPIVLGFGCYHGRRRYSANFELFTEALHLPRERRDEALSECAQRFADRLAHYTRQAPYNWFNFYDYWAPRDTDPISTGNAGSTGIA
jgi:predicted LPLAT superfamily acyltransferase